MISWIKTLTPLARVIAGAVLFVGVLVLVLSLTHCGDNREAAEQAKQTNRSGEAITAAASDAIETIGDRVATEKNIDDAVTDAQKDIADVQDPNVIRNIVIDGVCKQNSHRHDPACRVR